MVHPNTDPTGIAGDIVNAIRHRPAERLAQEVIHLHLFRIALWTPLPPGILEVANQFLLLRVDRDHRLLRRQRGCHALIDVKELRVAVGMIAPLAGLAVALQAELLLPEQCADVGAADRMPACRQFRCQLSQTLAGPAQRRHRIAPFAGLDQRHQLGQQLGVADNQRLAAAAATPHPAGCQRGLACQILQATSDCADRNARGKRHCGDTAVSAGTRLHRSQQAALSLIQMRGQHGKTFANRVKVDHPSRLSPNESAENPALSDGLNPIRLFPDGPLGDNDCPL
jgi:hypothetical protein